MNLCQTMWKLIRQAISILPSPENRPLSIIYRVKRFVLLYLYYLGSVITLVNVFLSRNVGGLRLKGGTSVPPKA